MSELAVVQYLCHFAARLAGVESKCFDVALVEMFYLVFHQGHEGRNDEAQTISVGIIFGLHGHGRHLKADTLSASRREKSQRIAAATHTFDDFRLEGAEIIIVPVLAQYVEVF